MTGTMIEKRRFYVGVLGWFLTFISIRTIAGFHRLAAFFVFIINSLPFFQSDAKTPSLTVDDLATSFIVSLRFSPVRIKSDGVSVSTEVSVIV